MIEDEQTLQFNEAFIDYFRLPEVYVSFALRGDMCSGEGYFCFGPDLIFFGQSSVGYHADTPAKATCDLLYHIRTEGKTCYIPFNPSEVIRNLREERYVRPASSNGPRAKRPKLVHQAYYALRPHLGVSTRKYLQRFRLRGWEKKLFPSWPVDRTVDQIMERLLALSLKAQGVDRIPFIWFWPNGHKSCAVLTHDVEESAGLESCSSFMDIDDSFGIKSSFQFIPEKRYSVSPALLNRIRERGFEVNVHDLNHDGHLYDDREEFLRRAAKINQYAKEYGAAGFRSAVLYRNLEWYDAYDFSYDMSVPNVARLDPQPAGCCTITPYFVGKVLELPLTTTQDYTLFNILSDFSINLWQRQIKLITENHGLLSFNVHPDYTVGQHARDIYGQLLTHLAQLRSDGEIWTTLPREVDRWWRDRGKMKLVSEGGGWRIEGPQKERARIAYAQVEDDRVVYRLETKS